MLPKGDKVDASVLKAAETQSTVAVAIYLQDEPPSKQISEEVKTRFRPNIRAKSTEIRNRIRSFRSTETSASTECQSGGAGDARKPRDADPADATRDWTAAEESCVAASQQRVRTSDRECGRHGSCTGRTRQSHGWHNSLLPL